MPVVRAVLVRLALSLPLGVLVIGTAFAAPGAAAEAPQALGGARGGLAEAASAGTGWADCVTDPVSEDGGFTVDHTSPYVPSIDGCDGREGSATFTIATLGSNAWLASWWTGDPGTGAWHGLFAQYDGALVLTDCGVLAAPGSIVAGDPLTVTWEISSSGTTISAHQGADDWDETFPSCGSSAALSMQIGGLQGIGICRCGVMVTHISGEAWGFIPEEEPEEDPCPSWTPGFLCDAATGIGDFTGPITDVLGDLISVVGDLGSLIVGALGDVANTIAEAIGAIAAQIWEVFKTVVLDPEEIGAWWDEFYAELEESPLASWVSGISDLVATAVPTVQSGTMSGLCIGDGVCLGGVLSTMPGPVEVMLSVLMYGWCFITMCHAAGQVVKTVRR